MNSEDAFGLAFWIVLFGLSIFWIKSCRDAEFEHARMTCVAATKDRDLCK